MARLSSSSPWMGVVASAAVMIVLCAAMPPAAAQDTPLVCVSGGKVLCRASCPARCPGKCFLVCPTCKTYCLCEFYPEQFPCVTSGVTDPRALHWLNQFNGGLRV